MYNNSMSDSFCFRTQYSYNKKELNTKSPTCAAVPGGSPLLSSRTKLFPHSSFALPFTHHEVVALSVRSRHHRRLDLRRVR